MKPKVDNKWVEEKDILRTKLAQQLLAEGVQLTMSVTKEIDEFIDNDVYQLLTQTQQDTLEWCLKEVVGKNKNPNRFFNDENKMRAIGRNRLKSHQRQIIKKEMEEGR